MSILIEGMEMPKDCSDCSLCYDMMKCSISDIKFFKEKEQVFDFCAERHPNCPLTHVPMYKRLIDADELKNTVFESLNNAIADCNSTPFGEALCTFIAENIIDEIEAAPTIISTKENK